MTRRQHIRRTLILCIHCSRNLAYYDAGWKRKKPIFEGQFLIAANSNFLDVAMLEWCKLFGDAKAVHHWKRVVPDPAAFEPALYRRLSCTSNEFVSFVQEVRAYRDKFIAHLDQEEIMHIPLLAKMRLSVLHLYQHLMGGEGKTFAPDAPPQLARLYGRLRAEGTSFYALAAERRPGS